MQRPQRSLPPRLSSQPSGRVDGQLEDGVGPHFERVALRRRPYRALGAVVALATVIALAGYAGSLGGRAGGPPAAFATGAAATGQSASGPPGSAVPPASPSAPPRLAALAAESPRRAAIALPKGIDETVLATTAGSLFFVAPGGTALESVELVASSRPRTIASVAACHSIVQIAAAAGNVAFVDLARPPARAGSVSRGCAAPAATAATNWQMWLIDALSGARRQIASGVLPAGADGTSGIRIALSSEAFALVRLGAAPVWSAGAPAGRTVEVHRLADGGLLIATSVEQDVQQLLLGGTRVAVVANAGDPFRVGGKGSWLRLLSADPSQPILRGIADPLGSASISPDGAYLAWDEPRSWTYRQPIVMVHAFAGDRTWQLGPPADRLADAAAGPIAFDGPCGPLFAWQEKAPADPSRTGIAVADGCSPNGSLIPETRSTTWLGMQDDELVWLSHADGGGPVASVVDVAEESIP